MYYVQINTKGIKEHLTGSKATSLHRAITEVLEQLYLDNLNIFKMSIRTLQSKLKELNTYDSLEVEVNNTIITILKTKNI